MALTANREVDHYIDQEIRTFQVAAGAHIYKGALVGLDADGYSRPLTAGDPFVGIAYEEMDNTGGSNGDVSVRVYTLGDFGLSLAGADLASIGRPVFASADDTLTFEADGNSYAGIMQDLISPGEIILRIDPNRRAVKTVTHAVEDLSAGGDIGARAVHQFQAEAWIVGARVVNQATAAAGIDAGNTCVVTLAGGAGTVASETFNATTPFPDPNSGHVIGSLANVHVAPGEVLTLAVTNGATANPGPFLVEVDYV
jgi:hypothetical protein